MRVLPFALLALATSGCVSYSVATTAETLEPGTHTFASILEVTPAADPDNDACAHQYEPASCYGSATGGFAQPMLSGEVRFGLTPESDAGVRLVGYSGLVASYKYRMTPDTARVALALMGGAGVINGGNHAEVEGTFLISRPSGALSPYGGLRFMQAFALSSEVPTDRPTVGAFLGLRLGTRERGVSPEVGVFYDPSALGLRKRTIVVVPSLVFHGRGGRGGRGMW